MHTLVFLLKPYKVNTKKNRNQEVQQIEQGKLVNQKMKKVNVKRNKILHAN